ncbi:MAG: sugar ABC transporter permease [Eubacteriales bacterium]
MRKKLRGVLIAPAAILLAIFFIVPIVLTIYYSFTNLALSGENAANFKFVGLANYQALFRDLTVRKSIINTLIFLLGSLVGQQILGFMIAVLMKGKHKVFRGIVGPIFLLGWIIPEVVVAMCCTTFFGEYGTLNQILSFFTIPRVEWLYEIPMVTIILANVWRGTAFSMMNFQSALDGVSSDIEEAAKVDGASKLYTMIKIIIPCIKNTIATNTMLNTLSTLGVFGLVYMMTGGGPGTSTLTLPIFMYRQAFISQQLGYGTAIAMLLLMIGMILSICYTRILKVD